MGLRTANAVELLSTEGMWSDLYDLLCKELGPQNLQFDVVSDLIILIQKNMTLKEGARKAKCLSMMAFKGENTKIIEFQDMQVLPQAIPASICWKVL